MKKLITTLLLSTTILAQENLIQIDVTKNKHQIFYEESTKKCYIVYSYDFDMIMYPIKCPYDLKEKLTNKVKNAY